MAITLTVGLAACGQAETDSGANDNASTVASANSTTPTPTATLESTIKPESTATPVPTATQEPKATPVPTATQEPKATPTPTEIPDFTGFWSVNADDKLSDYYGRSGVGDDYEIIYIDKEYKYYSITSYECFNLGSIGNCIENICAPQLTISEEGLLGYTKAIVYEPDNGPYIGIYNGKIYGSNEPDIFGDYWYIGYTEDTITKETKTIKYTNSYDEKCTISIHSVYSPTRKISFKWTSDNVIEVTEDSGKSTVWYKIASVEDYDSSSDVDWREGEDYWGDDGLYEEDFEEDW